MKTNPRLLFNLIPGILSGDRMMNASIEVNNEDGTVPAVGVLDNERRKKCYDGCSLRCTGITSIGLMSLNFESLMSPAEIEKAAKCHPKPVSTK